MRQTGIVYDGKPITAPCVVKSMPIEVYHSQCCDGPSFSSTNLRRVLEVNGGSPAHMYSEWSGNPNRVEDDEEAVAFVIGRAVHHLLLGEKMFSSQFAIRPSRWRDWRTDDAKAWREYIRSTGRSVLTLADIEHIKGMTIAVSRDPLVRAGALNGAIERSIFWRDQETGLWLKARPDAIPTDSGDFTDLKTTLSVQYDDLARTVRKFGYHQQAALVAEGAKIVAGVELSSFTFLFVEKKPPYCVRALNLKPQDIELGHKQNRAARLLIAACMKSGHWQGPGDGNIVNIDLGDRYRGVAVSNAENIYRGLERTQHD